MILMAPYVEREATRSCRSFFLSVEGSSFKIEASMAGTPAKFEYVSMLARFEADFVESSQLLCVKNVCKLGFG